MTFKTVFINELKKYYQRKDHRVIFRNGQSLNQLALSLWEELNCSSIDASVLSKILQGERSFTANQLQPFCRLLQLSFKEKIDLVNCWREFVLANKGFHQLSPFFLSANDEYIYCLITSCFELLYQGKSSLSFEYAEFILDHVLTDEAISQELKVLLLYLRGRYYGSTANGKELVDRTRGIVNHLKKINVADHNLKIGMVNTLQANCYYVQAKYSKSKRHITHGLKLCQQALPINYLMSEKIFLARTYLSLAILSQDNSLIASVRQEVGEILKQVNQPHDFVSGYHLASAISLSFAKQDLTKSLSLLKEYKDKFQLNIFNKGNYSLSFIMNEVEILLLANESKSKINSLVSQGCALALQEKIGRYQDYFCHLDRMIN